MKSLKIIFINLLFCLLGYMNILAQNPRTTMDSLMQYNWLTVFYIKATDSISELRKFSSTEIKWYAIYEGEATREMKCYYYLSNEPDTIFNMDKIGRFTSGRYIITEREGIIYSRCKITRLSNTEFEFLPLPLLDNEIRIGKPDYSPIIYRAVSK